MDYDDEGGRLPLDIEARPRPGRTARWAGGGGGGGYGAPAFVIGAPYVEKPPGARDFNLFSTLAARTSVNTPALFPTAQFQIPAGNVGVIRAVSLLVNNLLVTSDVRFDLLFNESAVVGWNNLTVNPRAAGSVEVSWTPEETFIMIPEGSVIDWRVRVIDAGTYQVSVGYHGWFYPVNLQLAADQAWTGG